MALGYHQHKDYTIRVFGNHADADASEANETDVGIYGLVDLTSSSLRYIGQSRDVYRRLGVHLYDAQKFKTRSAKDDWLVARMDAILAVEFERVSAEAATMVENSYIAVGIAMDLPLLNVVAARKTRIGVGKDWQRRIRVALGRVNSGDWKGYPTYRYTRAATTPLQFDMMERIGYLETVVALLCERLGIEPKTLDSGNGHG